jgi:hypothetical protein
MSDNDLIELHSNLATSLHDLHKKALSVKTNLRDSSRSNANKHRKPQPVNFGLGDFVLVANPLQTEKLAAKWTGPYRVVELVNNHVFR